MNQQIVAALQVRLKTFAAAQSPVLRVAYTLVPFTPTATETYLADFHLPANPFNPDISIKRTRFVGIYQVDVNGPAAGNPVTLRTLADAVATHFPRNLQLQGAGIVVRIDAVSAVGPALPDTARTKIPVSIRYRADRVIPA
jgi:hypothetical protein